MLNITGQVINIYSRPKTFKNGEQIEPKPQVQLMGTVNLPNGQSRVDLITLSTDEPAAFREYQDENVTVPVGVFAPSKGTIIYFIPQGSKPTKA